MYNFKLSLLVFAILGCWLALAPAVVAQEFSEWSAPVNLGPVVNSVCPPGMTTCSDQHPNLSKDGLSLYFSSDRLGGCGGLDIYVSQRASTDSPWEAPENLYKDRLAHGQPCVINSIANDIGPNLTTDGHTLFFHSFRANDNCGGADIYYAHRHNRRDDFGWEAPINLNRFGRDPNEPLMCGAVGSTTLVNTPNSDGGAAYFADDTTGMTILYFTRSNLPTQLGDFDVYTAALGVDGTWGTILRDNELSTTPYRDTRVAIRRRDGLELILASERPGFPPGSDPRKLWFSTRMSTLEPWSTPVLLPNVNSTGVDGAPGLSWDGTELYFYSNRAGAAAGNDLYLSTRTKLTGPQH